MIARKGLTTYYGTVPGLRDVTVGLKKGGRHGLLIIDGECHHTMKTYLFEHPWSHAQAT